MAGAFNYSMPWACFDTYTRRIVEQDTLSLPCREPTRESPVVPCCAIGFRCLSDGFCLGTSTICPNGANNCSYDHYYYGGCTDPNFSDPSCGQHCKFLFSKTVAYGNESLEWSCCNTFNLSSNYPSAKCLLPESNERWKYPTPQQLSTFSQLPFIQPTAWKTGPPSFPPVTSTSAPSTSTPSSSSNSTSSSSSGLSSSAKVGLGVGLGLGIPLLLLLLGAFFMLHRRRRAASRATESTGEQTLGKMSSFDESPYSQNTSLRTETLAHYAPVELEGDTAEPREMPTNHSFTEMPAAHGSSEMSVPKLAPAQL